MGRPSLEERLRAWSTDPVQKAALEQIISGGWLRHRSFVRLCVVKIEGSPEAVIDWAELLGLAETMGCTAPEQARALVVIYNQAARSWGGHVPY
jgi:hypothetical protein